MDPLRWLTTPSCIQLCLQFLWHNNIRIQPLGTNLNPGRNRDKGVMEAFASFINDTPSLCCLNRCRMQKKVVWLREMFEPDGNTVQEEALTPKTFLFSPFQWPIKHHTTLADWSLWKCCILSMQDWYSLGTWILAENNYYNRSLTLVTHLGDTLFLWHTDKPWSCHSRISTGRSSRMTTFRKVGFYITHCLPPNCYQVSLSNLASANVFTIIPPVSTQTRSSEITPHPLSYCTHQYVHQSDTTSQLQDFSTGKVWCGSNGSFVPWWKKGSFACRIESKNGNEFVEGGGIVPGPPEAQCLFLSEIGGFKGLVYEVKYLETLTPPAPILLTGNDSLSTLHCCMSPWYSVKARCAHCDLLSHLQTSIHLNNSNHAWMHVKAHQTRTKIRCQLSKIALLNENMDALATKITEAFPKADRFQSTIGMPSVYCGKVWITGNVKHTLYQLITRQLVQAYLEDKKISGPGMYDLIDWVTIRKARGYNHNRDLCMSKIIICNQLPTVQILHRRQHVTSDKCPFCKVAVEDVQHIFRCTHQARQEQWKERLQHLTQWLQEQSTEPGLQQMLIIMLNQWHNHNAWSLFRCSDPILNRAAWDQHAIGWVILLKGFIAKSIIITQHAYFQYIGSLQSGTVWAAAFCK